MQVGNKNEYKNLVRKFLGNRPPSRDLGAGGRLILRWIKMDLRVTGSSKDCMTLCAPVAFAGVPSMATLTRVVQA